MSGSNGPTIAIAGNPNCGKTSLFNTLTGGNQKVGNFPGVTVDRISTKVKLKGFGAVRMIDLPGTYSLFPNSADERITTEVLLSADHEDHPDLVIYVADASQLERHLLGFTQIIDLGFNVVLVLNMIDEFKREGHQIDLDQLQKEFGVPVIAVSSRTQENIADLKVLISELLQHPANPIKTSFQIPLLNEHITGRKNGEDRSYLNWLLCHHREWLPAANRLTFETVDTFEPLKEQINETFTRLDAIQKLVGKVVQKTGAAFSITDAWDRVLTHRLWGPLIFVVLMLLVFQAIFAWATYPMDWIEASLGYFGATLEKILPNGWLSDLIVEGVIPGIAGVLVFVPQIAILFLLISILEEIGYMARAVYLFDRMLQRYGMNGRSIVALISGGACAIPAIMSTRTIVNWKERLITILVTPFISCSARIPVYTVLVAFVVPYESVLGIFNSQGLAFAGLYLLGILAALASGWILKKVLKSEVTSLFVMELPNYRSPSWRSVKRTVFSKVGAFIKEAGKIILIISILLWFLASFGMPGQMSQAEELAKREGTQLGLDSQELADMVASKKMEASFAGVIGRGIEPIIEPLGYDWKIGIGLLCSFAAREVFIGSLATIYSIGSEEDEFRIREHLSLQTDPETGEKIFNYATALSLLLFFVFAMQCMSTLAVVRTETMSWKWPIIQFVVMTLLAYFVALFAYQASI